jgi:hypothetical protein
MSADLGFRIPPLPLALHASGSARRTTAQITNRGTTWNTARQPISRHLAKYVAGKRPGSRFRLSEYQSRRPMIHDGE